MVRKEPWEEVKEFVMEGTRTGVILSWGILRMERFKREWEVRSIEKRKQ